MVTQNSSKLFLLSFSNFFFKKLEIPDPKTSRNLTILAKTVQNLANLVPFGNKEPFMEEMNEVINAKV